MSGPVGSLLGGISSITVESKSLTRLLKLSAILRYPVPTYICPANTDTVAAPQKR